MSKQTPDAARVELTNDILYLARTLVLDCQDIQQLRRVQTYLVRNVHEAVQDGVRTPVVNGEADSGVADPENGTGHYPPDSGQLLRDSERSWITGGAPCDDRR